MVYDDFDDLICYSEEHIQMMDEYELIATELIKIYGEFGAHHIAMFIHEHSPGSCSDSTLDSLLNF